MHVPLTQNQRPLPKHGKMSHWYSIKQTETCLGCKSVRIRFVKCLLNKKKQKIPFLTCTPKKSFTRFHYPLFKLLMGNFVHLWTNVHTLFKHEKGYLIDKQRESHFYWHLFDNSYSFIQCHIP